MKKTKVSGKYGTFSDHNQTFSIPVENWTAEFIEDREAMKNNAQFLIRDYTDAVDESTKCDEPEDYIVLGNEVFKEIDAAIKNERKIAVYAVAECVLDLSGV